MAKSILAKALQRMVLLEGLSEEVLQTVAENFLLPAASLDESLEIYMAIKQRFSEVLPFENCKRIRN
jgi:hypothetical protein